MYKGTSTLVLYIMMMPSLKGLTAHEDLTFVSRLPTCNRQSKCPPWWLEGDYKIWGARWCQTKTRAKPCVVGDAFRGVHCREWRQCAREEPSIGVPIPSIHSPKCITYLKGPRIEFSGFDWLEKHDALQNMWDALHKVRVPSITRGVFGLGHYKIHNKVFDWLHPNLG